MSTEGEQRIVRIAEAIVEDVIRFDTRVALAEALRCEENPSICGCPTCKGLAEKSRLHFEQCLEFELGVPIPVALAIVKTPNE